MKKIILTTGLALALSLPFAATAADYTIDTAGAHASINFKVSHLGYSFIKGRFEKFSGNFSYEANNLEASEIKVIVDTSSLNTNHAERDKHIRSEDFIYASKFPEAVFTSTKVTDLGNGAMTIAGDLSLYGKTKNITINANVIGEGKDPWGGYRAGFTGETRLELADFGIAIMGTSSYVDMELYVEGAQQ